MANENTIEREKLIDVLTTAYMKQCLTGASLEYRSGAASTIGFICGNLGLSEEATDNIPKEAKKRIDNGADAHPIVDPDRIKAMIKNHYSAVKQLLSDSLEGEVTS